MLDGNAKPQKKANNICELARIAAADAAWHSSYKATKLRALQSLPMSAILCFGSLNNPIIKVKILLSCWHTVGNTVALMKTLERMGTRRNKLFSLCWEAVLLWKLDILTRTSSCSGAIFTCMKYWNTKLEIEVTFVTLVLTVAIAVSCELLSSTGGALYKYAIDPL